MSQLSRAASASQGLPGLDNPSRPSSSRATSLSQLNDIDTPSSPSSRRAGSRLTVATSSSPENVMVSVRVRPTADPEQSHVWDISNGPVGQVSMKHEWREKMRRIGNDGFQFDYVYTGSQNEEVYRNSVADLVHSAIDGYDGTVFAYGQTSSGKTFTMMGQDDNAGVIPLAVRDIFYHIGETSGHREFLLRVSYMEIYNETIHDLLVPQNTDLKIHEDKERGIFVSPLKEEIVTSPQHVLDVLKLGKANRHISSTDFNEHSSRSHTIFQMVIESRERTPSSPSLNNLGRKRGTSTTNEQGLSGPVRVSVLNLIDLAGSEKATSSQDRRREGAYINRSLLTLGTVISKITEGKSAHIPYRDSKLTRILQSSLQGNARISVVCTINPLVTNYEETLNTLKFAQRIKKVITQAHTHEIMNEKALLQQYRNEINDLKAKLQEVSSSDVERSQLALEKQRLEEELNQQQIVRSALKDRIDQLTKLILTSSSFPGHPFSSASTFSKLNTSPTTEKLVKELEDKTSSLEEQKDQTAIVREILQEKEEQIAKLERELAQEKAKSTTSLVLSEKESTNDSDVLAFLRSENERLVQTNHDLQVAVKAQNQKISQLESELTVLKSIKIPTSPSSPTENLVNLTDSRTTAITSDKVMLDDKYIDPDKYTELLHQLDQMQERIDELTEDNHRCHAAFRELAKHLYDEPPPSPLGHPGWMTPPASTRKQPRHRDSNVSDLVKAYSALTIESPTREHVDEVVSQYVPPPHDDTTHETYEMKPRKRSNVERLEQYLRELEKETHYE